MAIEVSRRDTSPSITHSTRDAVSVPSATSNSAPTSNAYSVQEAASTTSAFGSSVKKRRHSKSKTGKSLPRSLSTPHLRAPVMSDSDIDKKRNKLGYQRISIACGKFFLPRGLFATVPHLVHEHESEHTDQPQPIVVVEKYDV